MTTRAILGIPQIYRPICSQVKNKNRSVPIFYPSFPNRLCLKSQSILHQLVDRFHRNYRCQREQDSGAIFFKPFIYTALQATRTTNRGNECRGFGIFTTPPGVVLPEPLFFFSVPLCLCGK
jgi:hypothetical protein